MGENTKIKEHESTAFRLREQIRHTESDIAETVHTLEQRLSPRYVGQRGARAAQRLAWQGTARVLDLAQRTTVQASLAMAGVGAGALWLLLRNRKAPHEGALRVPGPHAAPTQHEAGAAARLAGASALWMLARKGKERERGTTAAPDRKPAVSKLALAALGAKAFLSGARSSKKSGTTRPGRKTAWRGLATAIGSALGSCWYSHKGHRV
jgi:hypothetical protein